MRDLIHLLEPRRAGLGRPMGQRGASAVEYGLLIAGIAALIVVAVVLFGGSVLGLFSGTCEKLSTAQSSGTCA